MEARRSRYGLTACTASLGLQAAVLSLAFRRIGPAAETPSRPPVLLFLVGAGFARAAPAQPFVQAKPLSEVSPPAFSVPTPAPPPAEAGRRHAA